MNDTKKFYLNCCQRLHDPIWFDGKGDESAPCPHCALLYKFHSLKRDFAEVYQENFDLKKDFRTQANIAARMFQEEQAKLEEGKV